MERALVVGGTGMLAGVAETLVTRSVDTMVVARRTKRTPAGTRGIPVDYRDTGEFEACVRAAGPFDLAVVWIHSVAPDAPLALARVLTEESRDRVPALRSQYDLDGKRVLLFVGALIEAKRLEDLIDAYARLSPRHPDLFLPDLR